MKELKILHVFPQLLSLYGEYGNVAVLKATLEEKGFSVSVAQCEDGNADFDAYDFVYVGAGTEDNLMVALQRLLPQAEAVKASIAAGKVWLATGNAMALFGKTLKRTEALPALGVFGYDTVIDDTKRYLGDVITGEAPTTLGFINTSCRYAGIDTPLMELLLNKELGNDKASPAEGIRQQNFFGTQLIGPFLVKNPHYMEMVCSLLTGEDVKLAPDSWLAKAYAVSRKELRSRAGLTD